MGLFDNFPYTNFHELNLDWILKVLKDIETTIDQFVSLNIIKYADPIQWDITRQYSKNTIVIDPATGTAYISVDNVPQGVALSNTDYWSVVFDLGRFITLASQNFAVSYEPVLTTTATMPTLEGGWIVWNSLLYEALNDIHVGDRYIEDGNIKKTPVEVFFNRLKAELNTEILNRVAADNALGGRIDQEILDRETADTGLGARIDQEIVDREHAIQEEIADRQAADTALGGRIDQEILDRQAADNALGGRIDQEIYDRQYAIAALKTAIDEDLLLNSNTVNVKAFGAVGNAKYYNKTTRTYWADSNYTEAPHNDVDAVNAAIAYAIAHNIDTIYFPNGFYYLPNWTYNMDISKMRFVGEGETALVSAGLTSGSFITISSPLDLNEYNTAKIPLVNISLWGSYGIGSGSAVNGLYINIPTNVVACHSSFVNVVVKDFFHGLDSNQGYKTIFYNFSAIACQVGIYLNSNSAIPQYFIGGFIECCGQGLFFDGPDWSNAIFYAYAFEYNLQQIAVSNGVIFDSCRFENDPLCTKQSYNFTINGQHVFFNNCDIMLLSNFELNVPNWIANPAQYKTATSITYALFAGSGDLHLLNSRIGLANIPIDAGFYLIGLRTYAINSEFNGNADAMSKLIDTANYQVISNTLL